MTQPAGQSLNCSTRFLAGLLFLVWFTIQLSGQNITFSEHIVPLLQKNCVECHNPRGIGPFSLLNYEQVKPRAQQIAEVVESRFMPPWKPDPSFGPKLQGEKRLTEEEVDIFIKWYDTGQLPGTGDLSIEAPEDSDIWKLGEPDLIVEIPEAYILTPEGKDVFHNFVIPNPTRETKYVRAVEFQPRARLVIHHAQITQDVSSWSREQDRSSPGLGFPGMELGNAENPSGYFIGWTPGQYPFQCYPEAPWELSPGSDIVLRLHMLPSGKPETVRPRIGFYFTDEAPTLKTVSVHLTDQSIDIPPGESNYTIEQSIHLPIATRVLGMYPHAHYIAKEMQIFAILPNGTTQGLLRIPDWDFNWQSDFRYVEPPALPAGTELLMRYTYDNSAENIRNPSNPPRRVRVGWDSSDEMGEIAINLLLENPDDLYAFNEAKVGYMRQSMGESQFFYRKGMEYLEMGRTDEAIEAFSISQQADPHNAPIANNFGVAFERKGQFAEARRQYEKAIAIEDSDRHFLNLFALLENHIDTSAAEELIARSLVEKPLRDNIRIAYVDYLLRNDRIPDAAQSLREGLELQPESPILNLRLGLLFSQSGSKANAKKHLNIAANSAGDDSDARTIQSDALFALTLQTIAEGDAKSAQLYLQQALDRKRDHTGAVFLAANAALKQDDTSLAGQLLQAFIDRSRFERLPTAEWIQRLPFPKGQILVADLYRKSGDFPEAKRLLEACIQYARQSKDRVSQEILEKALEFLNRE